MHFLFDDDDEIVPDNCTLVKNWSKTCCGYVHVQKDTFMHSFTHVWKLISDLIRHTSVPQSHNVFVFDFCWDIMLPSAALSVM